MQKLFPILLLLITIPLYSQVQKGQKDDDIPTITIRKKTIAQTLSPSNPAENFPRFPGCEEIDEDVNAKNSCAEVLFQEYLFANLKWPKTKEKIEGLIVGSVTITAAGDPINPQIIKSLHQEYDQEVLRVLKQMITEKIKWIPAKIQTMNVTQEFRFPVEING